MRAMCEINRLIETGEITSFAQKAPHDVHSMDQGKYHGSTGMINTPSSTEPFYYQVFKLGDKDRQVIAHGMQTGRTYQLIQSGGKWARMWTETDGRSAYQIWLDEGHKGNKAAFLAFLKGVKGDTGKFTDKGVFATHADVLAGVNYTKPINSKSLVWGDLMSKGGSGAKPFSIPVGANLNDYLQVGMYHLSASDTTGTNYPPEVALHQSGMLTVMENGNFTYQTYHSSANSHDGGNSTYTRTRLKTVWSHWEELVKVSKSFTYHKLIRNEKLADLPLGIYTIGSGTTSVDMPAPNIYGTLIVYGLGGRKCQQLESNTGVVYTRQWSGHTVMGWYTRGAMALVGTTLTITL